MPFFPVPGEGNYQMYFEEVPSSASVPTIFLHGNLGSNHWWYPAIDQFKEQGRGRYHETSYLLEFRGCGRSDYHLADGEIFPIHNICDDIIAFATWKKISKYNLVGHSTGGFICLETATRDPRVQKVAVVASVGVHGIEFSDDVFKIYEEMKSDIGLVEKVMRKTVKHKTQISPELWKDICYWVQVSVGRLGSAIPISLRGVDFTPQFQSIQKPVFILHGEDDGIIPVETARRLKSVIPNSQLRTLPNIGHSPNVEDPAAFAYILGEFFSA